LLLSCSAWICVCTHLRSVSLLMLSRTLSRLLTMMLRALSLRHHIVHPSQC
jgi:hypothetical protein